MNLFPIMISIIVKSRPKRSRRFDVEVGFPMLYTGRNREYGVVIGQILGSPTTEPATN